MNPRVSHRLKEQFDESEKRLKSAEVRNQRIADTLLRLQQDLVRHQVDFNRTVKKIQSIQQVKSPE